MKKKFLFAAAALAMLASCSQNDDLNSAPVVAEVENNAITFGTYVGGASSTRAGQTGSITTDALKTGTHKDYGFGVFAYYTGKVTYSATNGSSPTLAPNFMFNQQVKWDKDAAAGSVTNWTYAPLKYWPNEVADGSIDDQNNDSGNDPATTDYSNGGNLTFFAYAPYVDFSGDDTKGINKTSPTTGSSQGTEGGIVAINEKTALTSANAVKGDPTLTYKIATNGNTVDLLWGTYSGTSANVRGTDNNGVTSTAGAYVTTPLASRSNYQEDILKGYTTNADLTKQKTEGTVGFAFKHALAKVGGSSTTVPSGTTTNGLMVVLDLDDMKGGEKDGKKDATTLVTIKSIDIKSIAYTPDASTPEKGKNDVGYITTYYKNAGSIFNLATGKWDLKDVKTTEKTEATTINHKINATGDEANATLNSDLAESPAPTWSTSWSKEGVTTTKKNVYGAETNPFVFIPGTYPELTITIDYIVRTHDTNLATECSMVEQKVTKKLTFEKPVELNKQYNIVMHLGLTGVKFTATVSDWDVDGDDTNHDGDIDDTEITVQDVNLPINVSNVVATGEFKNSETLAVETAAHTSLATITVNGLSNGEKYTVALTPSIAGDVLLSPVLSESKFTASGTSQEFKLQMKPNTTASSVEHKFTITDSSSKTYTVKVTQPAGPAEP